MDDVFLKTPQRTIFHTDLLRWASLFRSKISSTSVIALGDTTSTEALMLVAVCWLAQIPVVPIPPHFSSSDRKRLLRLTGATHGWKCEAQEDLLDLTLDFEESMTFGGNTINYPEVSAESTVAFITTSGSTGTPKIVPIRREQIEVGALHASLKVNYQRGDCWLLTLPIFHIGGLSVIYRALIQQASVYFDTGNKAWPSLLIECPSITHLSLVPTQLYRWVTSSEFRTSTQLKAILLGGGPVSPILIERVQQHNLPVFCSYGMTETAAVISLQSVQEIDPQKVTVGFPQPPNTWKVNEDTTEGELWLKGPQVMNGYVDESHENGSEKEWFATGDWVRIHPQGLEILMRRKDRIVTGGENVNPLHIANVIFEQEGVTDVIVEGIPDQEWGQKMVVFIEIGTTIKRDEWKNFMIEKGVPNYAIPKQWIQLQVFPRLENGKVDRIRLLEYVQPTN